MTCRTRLHGTRDDTDSCPFDDGQKESLKYPFNQGGLDSHFRQIAHTAVSIKCTSTLGEKKVQVVRHWPRYILVNTLG